MPLANERIKKFVKTNFFSICDNTDKFGGNAR